MMASIVVYIIFLNAMFKKTSGVTLKGLRKAMGNDFKVMRWSRFSAFEEEKKDRFNEDDV